MPIIPTHTMQPAAAAMPAAPPDFLAGDHHQLRSAERLRFLPPFFERRMSVVEW